MATSSSSRPYLGRGHTFPFRPSATGALTWRSDEEAVAGAIDDILGTTPGERQMRPTYGAGLREFLFEPNGPITHRRIEQRTLDALVRWEPRIKVERVTARRDAQDERVVIVDIEYVVRGSNTAHNHVYPFYLTEGV